jgi:hypothetical protein
VHQPHSQQHDDQQCTAGGHDAPAELSGPHQLGNGDAHQDDGQQLKEGLYRRGASALILWHQVRDQALQWPVGYVGRELLQQDSHQQYPITAGQANGGQEDQV